MDEYGVTRDDVVDVLNGITLGGNKSLFDQIPGKTKSSFTRLYNGRTHMTANVFADHDSMFRKVMKGKRGKEKAEKKESQPLTESLPLDDVDDNEEALLAY